MLPTVASCATVVAGAARQNECKQKGKCRRCPYCTRHAHAPHHPHHPLRIATRNVIAVISDFNSIFLLEVIEKVECLVKVLSPIVP